MSLDFHEYANLFPFIEGPEFDQFVDDVRLNGIHQPIELYEGKILDGRNRYLALVRIHGEALELGPGWGAYAGNVLADDDLKPSVGLSWFRRYSIAENGDALTYVLSQNLSRRHMNESQRAMVASRLARLPRGRPKVQEPAENKSANLRINQSQAASTLNVSERSVQAAKVVQEKGTPELNKAVDGGSVAVSAAAEIAALPVEEQRARIAEIAKSPDTKKAFSGVVKELRREKQDDKRNRRDAREVELGDKQRALPDRKYGVILADPEWPFDVWSDATGNDRAAKNHYPTSSIEDIAARPVGTIAADDCVLLLWATVPKLPAALFVMARWGFDYVTHVAWVKDRIGTGYWFRNNHEILLVGKRGEPPKPADGTQFQSAIASPRGEHSEKPDWQYEIAERYFPTLPKIELNARRARPGWDAWGNEVQPQEANDERSEDAGSAGDDGVTASGGIGAGDREDQRDGGEDAGLGSDDADAGGAHQGHDGHPHDDSDGGADQPAEAAQDVHDPLKDRPAAEVPAGATAPEPAVDSGSVPIPEAEDGGRSSVGGDHEVTDQPGKLEQAGAGDGGPPISVPPASGDDELRIPDYLWRGPPRE